MISKEVNQVIQDSPHSQSLPFQNTEIENSHNNGFIILNQTQEVFIESSHDNPILSIIEKINNALELENPNLQVYKEISNLLKKYRGPLLHPTSTPFNNLYQKWKTDPKIIRYLDDESKRFHKKWVEWYGHYEKNEEGNSVYIPGKEARFMKRLRRQNAKNGIEMSDDELNKKALQARSRYFFPTMTIASLELPVSVADVVPKV